MAAAAAMRRVLMCQPKHFTVSYEINPWMNRTISVSNQESWKQWNQLRATLEKCGAEVHLVEPAEGQPDMVFTANAGTFYQNKVYLSRFRHTERQGEQHHFEKWFRKNGFEVHGAEKDVKDEEHSYEGAGDSLMAGHKFFGAYGFRTDEKVYSKLLKKLDLEKNPFVPVKLVDPRFYHLDTCFCPITPELAIWFPDAFCPESQKKMEKEIELIAAPEPEALGFACNSVVIGKNIVMPERCPETAKKLEKRGFKVHHVEMSEFLKSGGACKCLTLALWN